MIYIHPHNEAANAWWSSLSINEMKAIVAKHHAPLSLSHINQVQSRIVETYEIEHCLPKTPGIYQ